MSVDHNFQLLVMPTNFAAVVLVAVCYCFGLANGTLEIVGPSSSCGRVPIYEKILGFNINATDIKMEHQLDIDDSGMSRILFGLDAFNGEWPWVVRLKSHCEPHEGTCSCTGALISNEWILTAAHCVKTEDDSGAIEATLGLNDLILDQQLATKLKCDRQIVHPKYDGRFHNDIALLHLSKPVEYSDLIQPICLAPRHKHDKANGHQHNFARGRTCYAIGYGLNENLDFPNRLQKLEIKSAPCDKLAAEAEFDASHSVCILPKRSDVGGTCRGDSGGPNVCYDRETDRWFVFGIVSMGLYNCNQEKNPNDWLTASIDVSKYADWIRDSIKTSDSL